MTLLAFTPIQRLQKQQLPRNTILSGTQICVFFIFIFVRPKIIFLGLFLGKRDPPCENIDRDLHFDPGKKFSRTGISKLPKVRTLTRLTEYMTSPRGLSGGKAEPPDYILMFSSANVPSITYKSNLGNLCPPVLKKKMRVPPSDFRCHVLLCYSIGKTI